MLNGCATYLGYNLHHDVKILDTKYIDGIPNKEDGTNLKHLYVKVQIKKLREDVEYPYNVVEKLQEMVAVPFLGLFAPFEFLERLSGSHQSCSRGVDVENPHSYFTCLSQSWLIGLINPFQCTSAPPASKQTHLKTLEEKIEWKRADIALLELEGLLSEKGLYETKKEYEKALMMITKTKGEFIIPKTITSEELKELNKLQDNTNREEEKEKSVSLEDEKLYKQTKIAFDSDRDGNREIYVMNADGSEQRNLTNNSADEGYSSWSPDGKKIAFDSDRDGNDETYVMNADGSEQRRLTNNPANDGFPSWSPDGKKIAFDSDRDGNREIYVMNADGTNQRNLTNNPADDRSSSWSLEGKKIAFLSDRDKNLEIYVMNADGSEQRNLTNNPANDGFPSWSPDSKKIAFTSHGDGNFEIYVMNADGTNQRNLTDNPAFDGFPSWSPDSKKIAFRSERDGNDEIYVMNADGSEQRNLTNNSADDRSSSWSPFYLYEPENFLSQAEEFQRTNVTSALEEILQKEPNNIDARLSLASIYESNNLEDRAIKEYHKVVELAPENAYAHFALGNIYKNKSSQYMTINRAEEEWKKAIELEPNFIDAHHNLAVYYYEKKEYSKALEELEIVKKLTPNYPNIDKNIDLVKKRGE